MILNIKLSIERVSIAFLDLYLVLTLKHGFKRGAGMIVYLSLNR